MGSAQTKTGSVSAIVTRVW